MLESTPKLILMFKGCCSKASKIIVGISRGQNSMDSAIKIVMKRQAIRRKLEIRNEIVILAILVATISSTIIKRAIFCPRK